MRRQKVDSQRERRILIGLVTSKDFLASASKVLEGDLDLITSEAYRVVVKWSLDYFSEYRKAPGAHVEDLYHKWSEDNENEELVKSVKDFLESLSEQYKQGSEINVPYLLDDLRDFVSKRRIKHLQEEVEFALVAGRVRDAEEAVTSFRRVEVGQGAGIDPLNDRDAWRRAFADPTEPLFTFEGDAGRFFNPALTRDALVGIQAPEKTGKTFWCVELAIRALKQRRRVALFEVGDLSESQILRRLGVRWSGKPMWRSQTRKTIKVPTLIEFDEAEETGYLVRFEARRIKEVMTYQSVQSGIRKFRRAYGFAPRSKYLRASVHSTKTISVRGVAAILDQWEQEHAFIPDVVVIDYADILAPEDPKKEARHQVDETWAALRRLSQDRHCLVIAPTQANAMTYRHAGGKLQTRANFSEDKRKLAHCTGMLGLNQSPEEKEMQGMRVNWLALRESPFNEATPLYVGTCLPLGRPLCCSKFSSRVVGQE